MTPPEPKPAPAPRVASLDQFRGYTVAGMLLVNYMGRFAETPAILDHHNTYCSYADTIMPKFFVAVGCAYRLTFMKRLAAGGMGSAVAHALRRNLGLFLLAVVFYGLDGEVKKWDDLVELGLIGVLRQGFQREPFQTLALIAMTSVWVLPVIGRSVRAQLLYAAGSAVLYVVLSKLFYFDWAWNRPVIDGGPLSFLSWTTPLLAGSVAFDWISKRGSRGALMPLFVGGAVLMAIGYGVSCVGGVGTAGGSYGVGLAAAPFTPPEIPVNLWTMSQRTGSVSYLTFAAGFGLAVLGLFVVLCDLMGMRVGVFRTFGSNALITYIAHMLVFGTFRAYAPSDSPLLYAAIVSFLSGWVTYVFIRHLEKTGCFVRL
jgi:predicted acyltransferase